MGRSGTGLGMTVVWGTVKDHNGYIDVETRKEKAQLFSLYFPVSCKKIEVKTPSPSADSFRSRGEFILIVDDVKEQRLMLSEILEKLGYRVKALACGEEAVTWMENNSADLVVLDMIMDPGINGYETYKRILEIHKDQKAIIVSGFSETSYVKETLNLGAKEYIRSHTAFRRLAGRSGRSWTAEEV
jgi:CheY-like chemotaxis protein